MPIYEYECSKCGHVFEKMENFDSSRRKKCPICGRVAERIMPTGVGFIFKGSGFYATDYAGKKRKEEPKEAREEKKSDEKKN